MGLSLKKFNLDFRKVEKVDDQRMARQIIKSIQI